MAGNDVYQGGKEFLWFLGGTWFRVGTVLFDPRPKSSRGELFDRREELGVLDRLASQGEPLALVLGIRRIGKTSLLKSFLEEWHGVYVDMRGVSRERELYERLGEGLAHGKKRLIDFLRSVRGVRVVGVEVELKWRGQDSISLAGLFEELNRFGDRVVVVFDEAQLIRPPISTVLKNAIAYAYDHLENVTIVLSGSEIGLLKDFVGVDRPQSPLYGRYYYELVVERFPRDLAREFLEQGFREARVAVDRSVIEEALDAFDGIVGWLVFFGKSYIDGARSVEAVLEAATRIALSELAKLDKREKLVLKAIASGARSWSSVRRYIEEYMGTTIAKSSLTRTIRRLERLSIIRDYEFLDPIYEHASKKLRP